MKNVFISATGLLIPGVGHMILGKWGRGLVFLAVLTAMYLAGVALERDYYTKFGPNVFGLQALDPESALYPAATPDEEGRLDKVWKVIFAYGYPFFVGVVLYFVGYGWAKASVGLVEALPFVTKITEVPVTVRDIGYCFALLAGLLNLLVILDSYDIACNMDELRERNKA